MHFFYTDESGDTGKNLTDPNQPVFVMGGISVRDKGWNTTQKSLVKLYEDFFDGDIPEAFELHANQLLSLEGAGPFEGYKLEDRLQLARDLFDLIAEHKHNTHFVAFHKPDVKKVKCGLALDYNPSMPYLLGFDYLITYVNWYTKEKLGTSARALMVLDDKQEHRQKIIDILHARRFGGVAAHRVKWIVDVTYSVDSKRNPMVQLSDLVIFCVRRFLEIENGYREDWPDEAKQFYAENYLFIESRLAKKGIVERKEPKLARINEYIKEVRCVPKTRWKQRYGL